MLDAAISKAYSLFLETSIGVARERLAWFKMDEAGLWIPVLA